MSEISVEEQAKNLGWTDPDEWKGEPPPNGLKTAEEFIEAGDNTLAIAKENNDRLQRELSELKQSVVELKDITTRKHTSDREAGYNLSYREIDKQRTAAIEDADPEAVKAVEARKTALQEQQRKENEETAQAQVLKGNQDALTTFAANNTWVTDDYVLSQELQKAGQWLTNKDPTITNNPKAYLEEAAKLVRQAYPDHEVFREAPSLDSGGAQVSSPPSRSEGFSSIPAGDKATFRKLVSQSLFEDTKEGRAEFMRMYDE